MFHLFCCLMLRTMILPMAPELLYVGLGNHHFLFILMKRDTKHRVNQFNVWRGPLGKQNKLPTQLKRILLKISEKMKHLMHKHHRDSHGGCSLGLLHILYRNLYPMQILSVLSTDRRTNEFAFPFALREWQEHRICWIKTPSFNGKVQSPHQISFDVLGVPALSPSFCNFFC